LPTPAFRVELAEPIEGELRLDGSAPIQAPRSCRVKGVASPVPGSAIGFELWLPARGWNGRYYQLGNGGFAGNIHHPSLAAEVRRGNAAAVTDTGHRGDPFDASWAQGRPERIVDYGHRSIKATSDAAAALIRAYYGRPAQRRYFAGCSNGGRQALMAAQLYPEDWDGIIAGAPANRWTEQLAIFAAIQHRLRAVSGAWIPPARLPAIQASALAGCPRASVRGKIALDPRLCRFEPSVLLCRTGESDDCLSDPQVATLRLIQSAGFEPTGAAAPNNWTRWILAPPEVQSQLTFALSAFRYLARTDPGWRIESFDPRRDRFPPQIAAQLDSDRLDYGRFRALGGKIISYFGWNDAVISPRRGVDYYMAVRNAAGGADRARSFYRLFMVPGMHHCQGGEAPYAFGQSLDSPAASPRANHDIRAALEGWVERGRAPDFLIATDPQNRSRRLRLQPL
jgi:feruloyl esterase